MKLITETCDTVGCINSGRKTLVVQLLQWASLPKHLCRNCAPKEWAMAAEAQKEEWLRG